MNIINRIHQYYEAKEKLNNEYQIKHIARRHQISVQSVKNIVKGFDVQKISHLKNATIRQEHRIYCQLRDQCRLNCPKQIARETGKHVQTVYKWFWRHYPSDLNYYGG